MVINGPARRRLRAGRSSMLDNRRVRFRPGELGSEGRRRRCDPGEHSTRAAPLAAQTPPPQRPCRPAERDLTARGERALAARGERALHCMDNGGSLRRVPDCRLQTGSPSLQVKKN